MKCHWCQKSISGGNDEAKMVTAYKTPEGIAYTVPSERLKASGPLLYVGHYRCYRVADKRQTLSTVLSEHNNAPSVYDVSQGLLNRQDMEAQGLSPEEALARITGVMPTSDDVRQRDLALGRQKTISRDRETDPGHVEHEDADWRQQTTVDIEDIV